MPTVQTWRVSPETRLRWRTWGDETVVFHPGSADTHKLSAIGAEALRRLERDELSTQQLAEHLASEMGLDCDDDLVRSIDELVAQFDELGLVERVP